MSPRTINLTDELYEYLLSVSVREPPILEKLREETSQLSYAAMQISPDQGRFMALLVQLTGARKTIELGTFTGYSSLTVALAMPDDSLTVCCDVSREWTDIAQRYWQEAGVAEKIELHLRPGLETLGELIDRGQSGSFDFAFIDADKENYGGYYDQCLTLVRPGGLIAVDNVLWDGAVIDPHRNDPDTEAIRLFNSNMLADQRVEICMVSIGDGLTLIRKI
jgi:predicted O-methyltransferase YrrM